MRVKAYIGFPETSVYFSPLPPIIHCVRSNTIWHDIKRLQQLSNAISVFLIFHRYELKHQRASFKLYVFRMCMF